MSRDRRSFWRSPLVRVGLVLTPALAVLGLILSGNASSQAEAAVISKEAAAGFQTKDKLLVTLTVANPEGKNLRGTLRVELVDRDGKPFGSAKRNVVQNEAAASYRFELPVPRIRTDQVKVRCYFDKQRFEVPLSEILLAKEHETSVTASQEFYAGSIATIRCGVHGVKSVAESVPLAGADVEIRLKAKDGEITPLYKGKAGKDGIAAAEFKVPAVAPGQYTLEIETKSTLGQEKLVREIRVKAQPKILPVPDKPLYQPGQQIRIRALALGSFNLSPVSDKDLLFEVEDAKGNKVFKKSQKTSEYGIASLDFQLADEVNMGEYQIRATLGDQEARKTVTVKKYVLPKFKSELTADKRYYMPKETIQADLQSDYFFGKPVAGSKVEVKASTFDVQFRDFQKWEGKTNENGHAKFEIKLP